jgi:hypothetical protein
VLLRQRWIRRAARCLVWERIFERCAGHGLEAVVSERHLMRSIVQLGRLPTLTPASWSPPGAILTRSVLLAYG